jgi:LacI family transcriptional regulator
MAFIWEQAVHGIKVQDVAEALSCSRASLETRFKAVLGYSVHTAISKVRLERARRLVRETNLSLKQVAANTGSGPSST